ncbi:MAG: HlyD family secretion protein [Myxococcota bacterium]
MDKRLVVPLALVLVFGGGFLFYKLLSNSSQIVLTGFVEGEERIIRSKVTGRIEEAPGHEGVSVKKGDVLARIDDREIEARVAQANSQAQAVKGRLAEAQANLARVISDVEGRIVSARAGVSQMEANEEYARLELARNDRLYGERVVSSQLLDLARRNHRQATANLNAARAVLSVALGNRRMIDAARQNIEALKQQVAGQEEVLRQTQIQRSDYTVTAPFDGVLETKYIFEGELATPGSPIAGMISPDDRYVRVYIPVPDLDSLGLGTQVEIELDSQPGRRYAGAISYIANEAEFTPKNIETRDDRITQVYEAKATIMEGLEHFRPGAQGNVYVTRVPAPGPTPVAEARPDGDVP